MIILTFFSRALVWGRHQMLSFKEDLLFCPISDAEGKAQECKWRHWSRGHSSDIQSSVDDIMKDMENHILQDFSTVMVKGRIHLIFILRFLYNFVASQWCSEHSNFSLSIYVFSVKMLFSQKISNVLLWTPHYSLDPKVTNKLTNRCYNKTASDMLSSQHTAALSPPLASLYFGIKTTVVTSGVTLGLGNKTL